MESRLSFLAGFMPHNVAIQSTPFQNLEFSLIQQCILKVNLFFLDKIYIPEQTQYFREYNLSSSQLVERC